MLQTRFPFALSIVFTVAMFAGCTKSEVSYQAQVKPIFEQHCSECHVVGGKGYAESGFRVDGYEAIMKGTKYGPVIVPGSAVSSSLYRMVAGKTDPSIHMPHDGGSLSSEQVDTIEMWIDQGAENN